VTATYAVTNSWTSGFQAQLTLNNPQTTSVTNWKLEFDLAANITSIWDAQITSHVGNHYVITGASYDSTLPASGSVSFGFVAATTQGTPSPANYVLNGAPLGANTPPVVPSLTIGNATDTVSASGATSMVYTVGLSQPSQSAVTVKYATANGTAVAGTDYQAVSGTLTFPSGSTSQTITVPVNSISQPGANKTILLNLSSPAGATLAQTPAVGTIVNNIKPPAAGKIQYQDTSDWGTGFNGQITITNPGSTPMSGWTLQFTFPVQISSIWNATIVSHVGNTYVVKSAGWNDTIAAGSNVSFGFTASPGGSVALAGPTNYVLNGTATTGTTIGGGGSSGGSPGGTSQNPTAGNVTAWTYTGQPVTINVLASDSDPNQYPLTVASVTQGKNGAVVVNSDGTLSYKPVAGFTGTDTFNYAISNGHGGTATGTVTVSIVAIPSGAWPARVYAPYVDMTLYPTYNLASATQTAGIKYFSLGFVVADAQNQPAWGGYSEYAINGSAFDVQMQQQIAAVRSLGGDVMVSFGGAANQELAQAITNVNTLTAAYQSVINDYQLTHIDFDIEGAAVADHASIDRRSQAIAAAQQQAAAAGKPLYVWFTLPVLPTGLTADGLYVLQSALKYGVHIAGVNGMTMDYGDGAAPNPAGQMGTYAIDAAKSLFAQLQSLYGTSLTSAQLWSMVGVTPMIGMNDITDEVFTPQDAVQLAAFAESVGMGRISIWSLNRDQENPAGALTYVDTKSSSIVQSPFQFSKDLLAYQL
jgi:hypothetical protein